MALDLFRVSGGFQIDDSTQILEGAVAPTLDAPVGSLYTLTTNGTLYTKIAAGTGADKWSAIAGVDGILADIAAETSARIAADNVLQTNINTETTARIAGDAAQAAALATETTARIAGDAAQATALTTAIAAEVTARDAAIAAEAAARTAADTTLQNNIAAVDARVDALGNAFNYVGVLVGGAVVGTPTDLTALPISGKNPGDYYKVSTAGYFTDGTTTWHSNVGDGLVWNLYNQIDFIDNTNSQVQGTAAEITVGGNSDTGFVVGLDSAFSGRVSTLETSLTAETSARVSGDATNAAAILAETTARTAADTAETAARIAADATLTADLATEVSARIAADTAAGSALATEVAARIAGDTTLQANIDAEILARTAADTTLQTNIAAEAVARSAADTVIQTALTTLTNAVDRDGATTSATAVQALADSIAIPVVAVQWIVHVQDVAIPAKVSAYEVFAASNGTAVDFTRFGILKLSGGVGGVSVTASINGGSGIDLTVTTTANANIKIKRVAVV